VSFRKTIEKMKLKGNALPSVKMAGFRECPRPADDKFFLRAPL
jgi:hypothetical protein